MKVQREAESGGSEGGIEKAKEGLNKAANREKVSTHMGTNLSSRHLV